MASFAAGCGAGVVSGGFAVWSLLRAKLRAQEPKIADVQAHEQLHWKPDSDRRGLGDAMHKVNHIALIVEDVGDSLFFYTDIMGFQQIRRPNFDRHGAWLTMGNIELHLIKGKPHTKRGDHPADLIVSHIAIEVKDTDEVLERLRSLNRRYHKLHWRQNVSVPTPAQSRAMKFESDHSTANGKVVQFFVEDPNGYWLEICNCDVLTKFCFEQDDDGPALVHYSEGGDKMVRMVCQHAHVLMRTFTWVQRARGNLTAQRQPAYMRELLARVDPVPSTSVNSEHLNNLLSRRHTYGDVCQGFSDQELRSALALSGDDVPVAMLILKYKCEGQGYQVFSPPAYLDEAGNRQDTKSFHMPAMSRSTSWGLAQND